MTPWQSILDFWFGDQEPPEPAFRKRWFRGGAEVDQQISERFGELHQRAVDGELDAWLSHPHGRLALILLIDQFSRNLYRGQAEAFAWDHRAQQWTLEALDGEHYPALAASGRMFCLMPLMHAEDLALHDRLADAIEQLCTDFPEQQDFLDGLRTSAIEHRDIIVRFGRYPHRNAAVGRTNTDEEVAYLAGDAARFGQ
ncbi:hypothetical protein BGP77_14450 [Saccharospirillum sp. MSK14-1]|uniref:DUF924 family protein n=1 Tax=Saccharospirillum sp. MSK14-1 TaxID=1897632 RepID=UPI000D39C5C6|nr:DUF924 family protein [Saccharospirillum sp. MSK14-1]PTY37682.1 hypothetical protein BGP77_14450 [Saccharospirillum sp. MSK14-1]